MLSAEKRTRTYKYIFKFENGIEKIISIDVDNSNLNIIRKNSAPQPEWTRLKNFKCPNCPLSEAEHEYCPFAINLNDIIGTFSDSFSHVKVELTIITDEREYKKATSLQSAVSSLMGILMASSGCPILGMLKPMVRFHLPLSTLEET